MRQIVLDTETTGLEVALDHRIIEIGCVELRHRRQSGNNFHVYINPEREIDAGAVAVHGITNASLADKPQFADVAAELLRYLGEAELIIHNASFDLGFLNAELRRAGVQSPALETRLKVIDTLALARQLHPGQKNSLDALCKRYTVDNSRREFHGALLDAQLLAEVYLAMTGGQTAMSLDDATAAQLSAGESVAALLGRLGRRPPIVEPNAAELAEHQRRLQAIEQASEGNCLWLHPA
ncbi:MAG: DNA polymerase III subunit epsilon [Nevskiales bacterium]